MMKALYNLFLFLYPVGAKILSLKNEKAKKWLAGRKGIFEQMAAAITHDKPIIWVHCSSLGEFEQGKPLIEKLREQFPGTKTLITFFSPSGYEVQKDFKGADHIFYLPLDSASNANKFLDIVKPALIIFIKYEFWYYYIMEAKKRSIPVVLASATFRKNQPFFKWYGSFHKQMLRSFSWIFVQDAGSVDLLHSIGVTDVAFTGDTRFDRVLAIAREFQPIPAIEKFCAAHPVIVAGSTWTEDDKELDHFANENQHIRFIIAPHDISKARIDECLHLYKHSITFSEWNTTSEQVSSGAGQQSFKNVLIVDNIGLLSRLYHYATIAYVGGGFGAEGVHNVLEAAVYGKPVVVGPVYEKYIEAVQLIAAGGAFPVATALELEKQLHQLLDDAFVYMRACIAAQQFVASHAGATDKIMEYIQEKRLLTTWSKSFTV